MNFQFYYEKLINSEEYKKFKKQNPEAYACSGFFILDREKKDNKACIDFYLKKEKKMFSFKLDGKTEFTEIQNFDPRIPEKISTDHVFELEDFEKLIQEKAQQEKVKGQIKKLLFSLQNLKGTDYFVTTVFLSNLGLLKVNINIPKKKITSFEKKSFFDMIKVVKNKQKIN